MGGGDKIKSVAVVGAGAAGAITAAALKAENYYERIQVFERREAASGTWIHDADPKPDLNLQPGRLPPEIDPPLIIPSSLPHVAPPNQQERFAKTPVYDSLTTNVPDIAMSFSDSKFAYGPFAPHYIPRQYIENYFSTHGTDKFLMLNTTVEDISQIPGSSESGAVRWKLTLRRYDAPRHVDVWWKETFDAVILANGHYSVPYVPQVNGLEQYLERFPGRVVHSKYYRSPLPYSGKKILIIGNSSSGIDLTNDLLPLAHRPIIQSRRSTSRFDGDGPPLGVAWKPVITKFELDGTIRFEDGTYLSYEEVDHVIYCTGYKPSYPFWNANANGRELYDYKAGKLIKIYWHTFFQDFKTLAIVGMPKSLTFRSFEYQAIALARLWSGRNALSLPALNEQQRWEKEREEDCRINRTKFHDIPWDNGENWEYLDFLFKLAGLGTLGGEGRVPPVLGEDLVWALKHIRKYPDPREGKGDSDRTVERSEFSHAEANEGGADWVFIEVPKHKQDSLFFI